MGLFDGIIGSIIGSVAGGVSQGSSNRANRALQEDAQAYEAEQAATNREFQAGMFDKASDFTSAQTVKEMRFNKSEATRNRKFQKQQRATQYQTAVGDMKRAGLNPMLAYSQGGAGNNTGSAASVHAGNSPSPPSGGQGHSPMARMEPVVRGSEAVHSAMEVSRGVEEIKNLKEQNNLLKAQTYETQTRADQNIANVGAVGAHQKEMEQRVLNMREEVEKIRQEVKSGESQVVLNNIIGRLKTVEEQVAKRQISNIEAHTVLQQTEAKLKTLDLPAGDLKADVAKTVHGGLNAVKGLVGHSAEKFSRLFDKRYNPND